MEGGSSPKGNTGQTAVTRMGSIQEETEFLSPSSATQTEEGLCIPDQSTRVKGFLPRQISEIKDSERKLSLPTSGSPRLAVMRSIHTMGSKDDPRVLSIKREDPSRTPLNKTTWGTSFDSNVSSSHGDLGVTPEVRIQQSQDYLEAISDFGDPDPQKCDESKEDHKHCSVFRRFMHAINCKKNREKQKILYKSFDSFLSQENICLVAKMCYKKWSTVLRTILEEVPEGCDIVREQLDKLSAVDEESPKTITVDMRKLFEVGKPGGQSLILEELLSIRNRCFTTLGRSHDAVTALFKHPVMATFILQKWSKVKLSYFMHLRYCLVL